MVYWKKTLGNLISLLVFCVPTVISWSLLNLKFCRYVHIAKRMYKSTFSLDTEYLCTWTTFSTKPSNIRTSSGASHSISFKLSTARTSSPSSELPLISLLHLVLLCFFGVSVKILRPGFPPPRLPRFHVCTFETAESTIEFDDFALTYSGWKSYGADRLNTADSSSSGDVDKPISHKWS